MSRLRFVRSVLLAFVVSACASNAAKDPSGDAVPDVFDGPRDSATSPTLLGNLTTNVAGSFSTTARYLAWTFVAEAGAVVRLTADGPSLDTVLTVYRTSASGMPTGGALASNDDCARDVLSSCLEMSIAKSATYVAVVRRFDRGAAGTVRVSLERKGGDPDTGLAATFERPEVGLLVDAAGRRCTATLVAPSVIITAAHCVQPAPPITQQAATSGTFRVDVAAGRSETYGLVDYAAFGDTFDVALVRLDRDVTADIARPAVLAPHAPDPGAPLARFGYGRLAGESRAEVKRVFRYSAGADVGHTTNGDSGGPTFGADGLHFTTSGETERGVPIQIEIGECLAQLEYKLAHWSSVCPDGLVDWYSVCDASMTAMQSCWLGYIHAQTCMRGCVDGDFEGEGASCVEDLDP